MITNDENQTKMITNDENQTKMMKIRQSNKQKERRTGRKIEISYIRQQYFKTKRQHSWQKCQSEIFVQSQKAEF